MRFYAHRLNGSAVFTFLALLVAGSFQVLAAPGLDNYKDGREDVPRLSKMEQQVLRVAQATGGTTSVAKTTYDKRNVAAKASLQGDQARTIFRLTLTRGVPAEVFTLADPYRVIVDLPDVVFTLPADAGQSGRGLVSAYRFGHFAERKARVVLDTISPVTIQKATMERSRDGGFDLEIILVATDKESFGTGTGEKRAKPKMRPSMGILSEQENKAKQPDSMGQETDRGEQKVRKKPVIVIDAGHGGIDPGALGADNISEKTIVLAVAKRLKKKLDDMGLFSVFMTREKDVFLSLRQRVERSVARGADLFISLHADSIADARYARTVSGATVYTLSSRASDEQARLMAEKENNADALAGISSTPLEEAVDVRNILIDLLKRETANFSADLSRVLVRKLKNAVRLSRHPIRSADFRVLRQTGTPSVLIELGYMSNERDMRMMAGEKWQNKAANAIASAIRVYFNRINR